MKIAIIIFFYFFSSIAFSQNDARNIVTLDTTSYTIYPNPISTTGIISFNLLSSDTCGLKVFDIMGKADTIFFENSLLSEGQYSFEYSNEINGMYIVRLRVGGGMFMKKIIVGNSSYVHFTITTAFVNYATIGFNMSERDTVNFTVYNRWGEEIEMGITDSILNFGYHSIDIYANDSLPTGTYVYIAEIGDSTYNGTIAKINSSSIKESKILNTINIKPNPAIDFVILEFKDNSEKEIQIINQTGQIVYLEQGIKKKEIRINTQSFSKGIYFVSLINRNTILSKKLIISK